MAECRPLGVLGPCMHRNSSGESLCHAGSCFCECTHEHTVLFLHALKHYLNLSPCSFTPKYSCAFSLKGLSAFAVCPTDVCTG